AAADRCERTAPSPQARTAAIQLPLGAEDRMTDSEDAAVHAVQTLGVGSRDDRPPAQTTGAKLGSADDAVLSGRDVGDPRVDTSGWGVFCTYTCLNTPHALCSDESS